ncbi:hypothetical protein SISSUDRAFT_984329 [Sistotremastrum suecicum HHB10207 ss-3]|uniref:SGNH hydrolase-type esterase domain-containing protein n=1 Tax=Sistotremastrum suecicum HHB10207 ss-3 TaxID=1314776 RepID=A0A166EMT8_9AGAM|nr:hypothetical protein SISSUDRAFT_984329 [Sistotremastrum suecicum HHB10207 ss-3]
MAEASPDSFTIKNDNPLIHFHGRWDSGPGTWWAGSGFKLNVQDLQSLTLNLGPHTTQPLAAVGVSVNYEPFRTINVTEGANAIPLSASSTTLSLKKGSQSVVRINVEGWQDNRINLETIGLNAGAKLLPYTPQKLAFQFIGDSLSAGQYCPDGVDQAWTFLTGEDFKAEHNINAQPGAALTDIVSYGNEHGVSYQFFRTEDTGYYYTTDHNYTTPWNFARDQPEPTHIVIHIGANDNSQGVSAANFTQTYLAFIKNIRVHYPYQPIFAFTPWGWPNSDGSIGYYYQGVYEQIVKDRIATGDHNIFLVNTTGWVTWADVFPSNQHPSPSGHIKIAGLFTQWLNNWGLKAEKNWETPALV